MEILSRLPIKTLFDCRRVCKTWRNLLSDPHFAELHVARSPISLLLKTFHMRPESRMLHLFDLQGANTGHLDDRLKLKAEVNIPNFRFALLNSCNGLLCLCEPDYSDNPICVCNPILGEYITLPKVKVGMRCCGAGFGFSHETNQYKVIRVLARMDAASDNKDYEAEIYTLGGGAWRSIGNALFSMWCRSSFNTLVNGALHWLYGGCDNPDNIDYIPSFHFGSEEFGAIPAPAEKLMGYLHLGVLGGCLSICDGTNSDHIDIWIMKNYGVKESWSKDFVIDNLIFERHNLDFYEPIMILNSGEILILFNHDAVVLYSHETKGFDYLDIFGVKSMFEAIAHIPSFVSLRDVAKGENLKV
ncbi:hypothetical protein L1049_024588 [Liquidambar formosana]|uniref:F-box domain-containing protein n=1 Tax=Liquidambar formosana TaxID=63359 RepID=A0AAP0RV54_LIQFO